MFEYDVVVLQQPEGAWADVIRQLKTRGVVVLFEIDDYVHAVRKMASHEGREHWSRKRIEGLERTMRLADGLICSTEWLAGRYRTFNPNVVGVPQRARPRPLRLRPRAAHRRHDRLGRRHRPRDRARPVAARGRRRDARPRRRPLRHRRPAVRPRAGARVRPGARRGDPVRPPRDLPGLDDRVRHRARAVGRQQPVPRQERPALARGERARRAADRRPASSTPRSSTASPASTRPRPPTRARRSTR